MTGTPQTPRPADPERGLRGAMSASLILEAIVLLLAIPIVNAGHHAVAVGVVVILVLVVACIALCAFVRKPWFVPAALGLQALTIVGWIITPSLGVMGIVFALVWLFMLYLRNEYRRRLAAFQAAQSASRTQSKKRR